MLHPRSVKNQHRANIHILEHTVLWTLMSTRVACYNTCTYMCTTHVPTIAIPVGGSMLSILHTCTSIEYILQYWYRYTGPRVLEYTVHQHTCYNILINIAIPVACYGTRVPCMPVYCNRSKLIYLPGPAWHAQYPRVHVRTFLRASRGTLWDDLRGTVYTCGTRVLDKLLIIHRKYR